MQTLYRMISIGSAINQWHRGKSGRIATDWKDFKDLCNIICGHFLYYDSNQFRKIWKIRKNGVHIISLYKASPLIIIGITMHCG